METDIQSSLEAYKNYAKHQSFTEGHCLWLNSKQGVDRGKETLLTRPSTYLCGSFSPPLTILVRSCRRSDASRGGVQH